MGDSPKATPQAAGAAAGELSSSEIPNTSALPSTATPPAPVVKPVRKMFSGLSFKSLAQSAFSNRAELGDMDFVTDFVITLERRKNQDHFDWNVRYLEARLTDVGLIVKKEEVNDDKYFLKISASFEKLLDTAENLGLRKVLKSNGQRAPFSKNQRSCFKDNSDTVKFFTQSERQRMIVHLVETADFAKDDSLPGITANDGSRIIQAFKNHGYITQDFPLHETHQLDSLQRVWVFGTNRQPLEEIRTYFGERIAFYFAWLEVYTVFLLAPALMGLWVHWDQVTSGRSDPPSILLYSFLLCIWSTVFLEFWKRRSSELAFTWDTLGHTIFQHPRPQFKGVEKRSPVTGKVEVYSPASARYIVYACTTPILLLVLLSSYAFMMLNFYCQEHITEWTSWWILQRLPTVCYTLALPFLNSFYKWLAEKITNWENQRTDVEHESSFLVKRLLFELPNSYCSLFYAAFYVQDFDLLRRQLGTMLITMQIVGNCQEVLLPLAMQAWARSKQEAAAAKAEKNAEAKKPAAKRDELPENPTPPGSPALSAKYTAASLPEETSETTQATVNLLKTHASHLSKRGVGQNSAQVLLESQLEKWDSISEDYLEMVLQFGYCTFFASAFPLACLCAVVNNVIELRSDAFKLCSLSQRPRCKLAADIGIWYEVLVVMSVVAVMTNCALVSFTTNQLQNVVGGWWPDIELPVYKVMFMVGVEHLVLLLKILLASAIPDEPEWVEIELARQSFLANESHVNLQIQETDKKLKSFSDTVVKVAANSSVTFTTTARTSATTPAATVPTPGIPTPPKPPAGADTSTPRSHSATTVANPATRSQPGASGAKTPPLPLGDRVLGPKPPPLTLFPDYYAYLIVFLAFAYFLGYFSFHFLWLPWVYIMLASAETRHRRWMLTDAGLEGQHLTRRPHFTRYDESVEWINGFFQTVWTLYSDDMSKWLDAYLQTYLDYYRPAAIKSIKWDKFDLGKRPFRFDCFNFLHSKQDTDVVLDVGFTYDGDCDLVLGVKIGLINIPIAIKNLVIAGRMRIRLELLRQAPWIGMMGFSFYTAPKLDFILKPLKGMDLADLPGLSSWLDNLVETCISPLMVLPNEFKYQWATEDETNQAQYVLKLHLKRGFDLVAMDRGNSSDPYVKLKMGATEYKSKTIPKTLNPEWDETFEFPVERIKTDVLELHCWDEDLTKDDSMGVCTVDMASLPKGVPQPLTLHLEDVDSGQIECTATLQRVSGEESIPGLLEITLHSCSRVLIDENHIFFVICRNGPDNQSVSKSYKGGPEVYLGEKSSLIVEDKRTQKVTIEVMKSTCHPDDVDEDDTDVTVECIGTKVQPLCDLVDMEESKPWIALDKSPWGSALHAELKFIPSEQLLGADASRLQERGITADSRQHTAISGVLTIDKMFATNVRSGKWSRLVDTYFLSLKIGKNKQDTSEQKKSRTPQWTEAIELPVDNTKQQRLIVHINGKGLIDSYDIAKCTVLLTEYKHKTKNPVEVVVPFVRTKEAKEEGGETMMLHMSLSFEPCKKEEARRRAAPYTADNVIAMK